MKKLIIAFVLISTPAFAQTNQSSTQMQLINSQVFLNRIAYLLSQQAVLVKAELLATVCHAKRSAFADQVISSADLVARQSAILLAGSTNVVGTVVTTTNGFDSSATDAALASQINTLWNVLSKCDTGS